ncbi:MAG: winged helix-turn-helix transcriptional regulator [Ilumatobacteraceae bacterium]
MATQRYGQYCPISRALDLLGERWTLMIVRDMLIGATRFNDLARGLPGLSRSLLTQRLRMLERGGVVVRVDGEYLLTDAGQQLEPVVFGLGAWGARWTFDEPDPDELDAELLVWWIHMGLDTSMLAAGRHVFHVRFTDDKRRYWLVDDGTGPSMCHTDPGYPVDVTISSDVSSLYQVWLGRVPLAAALRSGRLRFEGPASIRRVMPDVLKLSPAAPLVAAAH